MKDFTKKISHKEMTLFLLPLILVKLFEQISGIFNMMVINRLLGQEIITCISACRVYPMLQNNLLGVTATGFGVYVTRYIGKKDQDELQSAVARALVGVGILTLAGFVLILFQDTLLSVANIPVNLYAQAGEYLFWLFAGSGALVCQNLFLSILYGLGESAFAGGISAAGICLQPILTLLFVELTGGGVRAIPQALLVNRLLLAIVLLGYLLWKYRHLFPLLMSHSTVPARSAGECCKGRLRFWGCKKAWGDLWGCGFSAAAMLLFVWCGSFLIQRQVNQMSEARISAYMYAVLVEDLILVPVWGCKEAASYIFAQNAGAGKFSQVRQYYRRLIKLAWMFCLVIFGVVWFFAPALIRLVAGPALEETLICANRWLRICVFAFPALAVNEIGRMNLQAVGAYRSMQFLGILEGVLRIVLALFVIAGSGFDALIWSFFCIFMCMGAASGICSRMALNRLAGEEKNGI